MYSMCMYICIIYIHICIYGKACMCHRVYVEIREQPKKLCLSTRRFWGLISVLRLGSKSLDLLSHLAGPENN